MGGGSSSQAKRPSARTGSNSDKHQHSLIDEKNSLVGPSEQAQSGREDSTGELGGHNSRTRSGGPRRTSSGGSLSRRRLSNESGTSSSGSLSSARRSSFDSGRLLAGAAGSRNASVYNSRTSELMRMPGSDYTSVYEWAMDSTDVTEMNIELQQSEEWQLAAISELQRMFRLVGSLSIIAQSKSAVDQTVSTIRLICEILNCESATVYLMDPETRDLRSVAGKQGHRVEIPRNCGATGFVATTLLPLRADHPERCPQFDPAYDAPQGVDVRNFIIVPMLETDLSVGKGCFGVLVAVNKFSGRDTAKDPDDAGAFTDDDELMLWTIATHARIHLDLVQKSSENQAESRQRAGLLSIARSLTSASLSTMRIVSSVSRKVKTLVGANRCCLYVVDMDTETLWTLPPNTSNIASPLAERRALAESPTGSVADSMEGKGVETSPSELIAFSIKTRSMLTACCKLGSTLRYDAVRSPDPRYNKEVDGAGKSMVFVPVKKRDGRTQAVLQVSGKLPSLENLTDESFLSGRGSVTFDGNKKLNEALSASDVIFVEGVGAMIGLALSNARRFEESRKANQQLDFLMQAVDDYIMMLDPKGHLVRCNKIALSPLFGDDVSIDRMKSESFTEWMKDEGLIKATSDVMDGRVDGGRVKVEGYTMNGTHQRTVDFSIRTVSGGSTVSAFQDELRAAASMTGGSFVQVNSEETKSGVVVCITDRTSEEKMRSTLDQYVSAPSIVDKLLNDEGEKVRSTTQKVTVLFSDIRGYTSSTEGQGDSDATLRALNEYFDVMVEAIRAERGTVDKFIGDAIMAVFGMPNSAQDDAARACRAALRMQRSLEGLNARRNARGDARLDIGIGIGTGMVVCGRLGGGNRFQYTVIGDPVNLTSRIESMCPNYGVEVLIDQNTEEEVRDTIACRYIDHVRAVGKEASTKIYEIFGLVKSAASNPDDDANLYSSSRVRSIAPLYKKGIDLYLSRDFRGAREAFKKVGEEATIPDEPTVVYTDRCNHLCDQPPPDDWDMIWDMQKLAIWTMGKRRGSYGSVVDISDGDGGGGAGESTASEPDDRHEELTLGEKPMPPEIRPRGSAQHLRDAMKFDESRDPSRAGSRCATPPGDGTSPNAVDPRTMSFRRRKNSVHLYDGDELNKKLKALSSSGDMSGNA